MRHTYQEPRMKLCVRMTTYAAWFHSPSKNHSADNPEWQPTFVWEIENLKLIQQISQVRYLRCARGFHAPHYADRRASSRGMGSGSWLYVCDRSFAEVNCATTSSWHENKAGNPSFIRMAVNHARSIFRPTSLVSPLLRMNSVRSLNPPGFICIPAMYFA